MTDRSIDTPVKPCAAEVARPVRGDQEADDDALILWMLSLTPAERLSAAQGFADSVTVLRRAQRT